MAETLPMNMYYEFRKEIHKLYENDVINNGDLCSSVLEIRDKYRSVESVSIDLKGHAIDIELGSNADYMETVEIAGKIANCIGRYIMQNIDKLNPSITELKEFDLFMGSENSIFCDIVILGGSIKFNL